MTGSVTVAYTVVAGVSLEDIASAAGNYVDTIIGDNPILQSRPLSQCIGRQIHIRTGINQLPTKVWPNPPTRWLTQEQLKENLAYIDSFANRQQARAAQRTGAAQVTTTSECAQEYVDLLHISEQNAQGALEHHFVPLTQAQVDEFEQEEAMVAELIDNFYTGLNAISSTDTEVINTAKQELFRRMIENTADRDKYGDIFHPAQVTKDEDGNRTPVDRNVSPDPTQLIEIKRLGTMPSSAQRGGENVEISDPPKLIDSPNAVRSATDNRIVSFRYVRGQRFRDMIRNAAYRVPPSGANPSWWNAQNNRVDTKELLNAIKELRNTEFSSKLEAKLEWTHEFINQAAHEWKDETNWPLPGIHANINVSREAQIFRLASNATAGFGYNPLDKTFVMAAKTQAQFDLISAKATTSFAWPVDELSRVTYQYGDDSQKDVVDFGCLQFYIKIEVSGFAGASGLIGADVQLDMSSGFPQMKASSAFPAPSKQVAEAGVEAFVGVKAGCKLEGLIRWQDTLDNNDWRTLAGIGLEATAYLGGTIVAKVHIAYEDGKFYMRCKAGAAWGFGASGEIAGSVNVNNIGTMAHFIYNGLLTVDFNRLSFVDTNAFKQLQLIGVVLVIKGLDWAVTQTQNIWEVIQTTANDFSNFFERLFSDWDEGKSLLLAKHIKSDVQKGAASVILHMPPEGKGQLLWRLLYKNTLNFGNIADEVVDAVFYLLGACQSLEEYHLTYPCMNKSGALARHPVQRQRDHDENMEKVAEAIASSKYSNYSINPLMYINQLNQIKEQLNNDVISALATPMPNCPVELNRCISKTEVAMLKRHDYSHYV